MVDFLFVIIDFFTISYGWDVISGNRSKSAFFKGGRSLSAQISEGWGRRPPTTVGVRKLEWLPFCVVSKYLQCIVWFCHKTRIWRTDGRENFDSNTVHCITCRTVKTVQSSVHQLLWISYLWALWLWSLVTLKHGRVRSADGTDRPTDIVPCIKWHAIAIATEETSYQ